jgi:chemotaxis protein methyltransferase CheR
MTMTAADFDFLRDLVRQRTAIVLESSKAYLAETRLAPLARRAGLPTVGALVARMARERDPRLNDEVVEAMATNETFFFRDIHPFSALRQTILPELIRKRAAERRLTIWCAACSSGQEPYSVAMLIREHFPSLLAWDLRIVASDISQAMLERCRAGRYNSLEVNRGLPAEHLLKYFRRDGLDWVLKDEVCRMVECRRLNLAEPWPMLPPADVILMRNVLIYFDLETKRQVLAKVRRQLRPDGVLILGAAETTLMIDETFERIQLERVSCYRVPQR